MEDDHYKVLDGSFTEEVSSTEEVVAKPKTNHICGVCNNTYKSKFALKRHTRKHGPPLPSCGICNQHFRDEESKGTHDMKFHARLLCNEFGKDFRSKSTLTSHMATAHKVVDDVAVSYSCPFDGCGKVFLSKVRFQFHTNKHTGLKPYSCSNCQRVFISNYKKTEHEKICKKEKEIKCEICNVNFTDSQSLKRHDDATHKGVVHICQCGRKYAHPASLHRHRRNQNH